jgi:hypothetical protein
MAQEKRVQLRVVLVRLRRPKQLCVLGVRDAFVDVEIGDDARARQLPVASAGDETYGQTSPNPLSFTLSGPVPALPPPSLSPDLCSGCPLSAAFPLLYALGKLRPSRLPIALFVVFSRDDSPVLFITSNGATRYQFLLQLLNPAAPTRCHLTGIYSEG